MHSICVNLAGVDDRRLAAEDFAELFQAVYLSFHRRDGKLNQLSGASSAMLQHLALAGPLTVGEMALHLNRAQSVVSEIVDGLQRKGLLERESDPADRRRTLVWLTHAGFLALQRDREVLSVDRVAEAFAEISSSDLDALVTSLRRLVRTGRDAPPALGQSPMRAIP